MVYRGPAGHIADVGQLEIGVVEGTTTVAVAKDPLRGLEAVEGVADAVPSHLFTAI